MQRWARAGGSSSPPTASSQTPLSGAQPQPRPLTAARCCLVQHCPEPPGRDSPTERGLSLCRGLQGRVQLVLLQLEPCLIQKGTVQLQDAPRTARRQLSLYSSPSGAGSCSRDTETSTSSPPLTAFPSALTTDSRAGGTHRTPNSSGDLGVPLPLISSSSRCFSPKAALLAVCPSGNAAGVCWSAGRTP